MKVSNTVVTVIMVAAVLVFAYGVGLLIRQARTGDRPVPAVTDAGKTQRTGPGTPRANDTPEARAQVKKARAQALEKMSSMTEEEKEKFRNQVRRMSGSRADSAVRQPQATSSVSVPPAKSDANTPASGDAGTKTKSDPSKTGPEVTPAGSAPVPQGENKNIERGTDQAGAEPSKTGPGQ